MSKLMSKYILKNLLNCIFFKDYRRIIQLQDRCTDRPLAWKSVAFKNVLNIKQSIEHFNDDLIQKMFL